MQEFSVDTAGWSAFWKRWEEGVKRVPGLKEAMLDKAGTEVLAEVRRAIARSGLDDRRGRVRLWQNRHIGTKLGYVAVRADSVEVLSGGGNQKPVNAGALTNYLASGHKVRGPSGRAKRYTPRARMVRVPGFGFYQMAAQGAEKTAVEAVEKFLKKLEVEMGL